LVTAKASKIDERVEVFGNSIGIESRLVGSREFSIASGFSNFEGHHLELTKVVDLAVTHGKRRGRAPVAVRVIGSLGSGEESFDGRLRGSAVHA
jgi:hypothetical protein